MSIAIAVKHLLAAGVTGDALVTAIAEMEAAMLPVDTRSKGAIRQARYRENKASLNVTKRNETSHSDAKVSPSSNKSNEINDRVTDVTHVTVTDVTDVTSSENDDAARVYNTTRAHALIPVVISNDITPIDKKTNKKDFAAPAVAVSEAFEKFWAVYPKKRAKDSALKNFQKAVKSGADPADLIAGAERYAKEVAGFDERYIKYPQGWLTEGRWKDEPANRGPPKRPGFTLGRSAMR